MATLSSITPLPSSLQPPQREAAVQSPDSSPNSSQPHRSRRRMSVQSPPPSQLRASKATAQRLSSHHRLSFENRIHCRQSGLLPPSRSHFLPVPALFYTTTSATVPSHFHTLASSALFHPSRIQLLA
ncbi:uncharacterized protein DS421_19g653090 [Arachis hypogaea]|uniref:Uncharacterized protein n=1 Tax=Arachis hypogaea TaxID=3818 RepID=A0A6B9V8W9_ARAHY|nr:uncharacterized protein DS421_19g653090 [Arachis hypogaea]